MKAPGKLIIAILIATFHFNAKSQVNLDGLYGLKYDKEYYTPVIFLKFKKDSFEFTDHRNEIKYGKGTWDFDSFRLRLNYIDPLYQKSFVSVFSDTPVTKSTTINLTVFVYDGLSKQNAFKPSISLYDSADKEIIEIKGDTSGKIISYIRMPQLFKRLRLNVSGEYSDPPEVDLSNSWGIIYTCTSLFI